MVRTLGPCVLLVNLGTPDAPTAKAVRPYLREFLSDRRVVEMHPAVWRPILEGILRVRPADSAKKYRSVWGPTGSPLLHFTAEQARKVDAALSGQSEVRYAMRYGSRSIPEALDQIMAEGYRQLLVVPLYPQYSATTSATVADEVYRWGLEARNQFDLRILRAFAKDPGYIAAVVAAIEATWAEKGRPDFAAGDKLILSFHGIPQAMADAGDPYPQEARLTSALIQQQLGLADGHMLHTYQSTFGPAAWLKPATIDTVKALGVRGTRRVDVVCPGFVSDCLETLEEINILNRETFIEAGGKEFRYIPWGNDRDVWVEALTRIVRDNLAGWL